MKTAPATHDLRSALYHLKRSLLLLVFDAEKPLTIIIGQTTYDFVRLGLLEAVRGRGAKRPLDNPSTPSRAIISSPLFLPGSPGV